MNYDNQSPPSTTPALVEVVKTINLGKINRGGIIDTLFLITALVEIEGGILHLIRFKPSAG